MPFISIERVVEIGLMRYAPAFFIPGFRTLPDQGDEFIAPFQGNWTGQACRLQTGKVVTVVDHGVNAAYRTQEVAVAIFVPHDAAGYGRRKLHFPKRSMTDNALNGH
jgi:hypothetical protein